MRETSDLEMPLSAPSALTRSSTLRVLTPCGGPQQARAVAVSLRQPLGGALMGRHPITAVSSASIKAW
jgi:hypothetical protein